MGHGPLKDTLKSGRLLRVFQPAGRELCQLRVEKRDQVVPQFFKINIASAEDGGGIRVICKRKQQMFKCCIFMVARTGNGEGPLQ